MLRRRKRKAHRKSRFGCRQCKERHAKCDERHPSCLRCRTADRPCSFQQLPPGSAGAGTVAAPPAEFSSATKAASAPSDGPPVQVEAGGIDSIARPDPLSYDIRHLMLLHHLETGMASLPETILLAGFVNREQQWDWIFRFASSTPYFMDELLAFSAMHLSSLQVDNPALRSAYFLQATELQTRALAGFSPAVADIRDDNCTLLLIFSFMVGVHTLFNAASMYGHFSEHVDGFVQFLEVHRGVRAIASQKRDFLASSELQNFILVMKIFATAQRTPDITAGPQAAKDAVDCNQLVDLITSSRETLGADPYAACMEALQALQCLFDQSTRAAKPASTYMLLNWAHDVPPAYPHLLRQRRPEALIILAHWAWLLHQESQFWAYGSAGRNVIEAIAEHLGAYWSKWLTKLTDALRGSAKSG